MHIAEGILPADWAALWYVIAFIFVGIGIFFIKRNTSRVQGLMLSQLATKHEFIVDPGRRSDIKSL